MTDTDLELLERISRRVLWLSTYMLHYANHVRPNPDGTKVGGHPASCASVVNMLTAYYFTAAEPGDFIAIKPHASPVYHAIQYLLGNLEKEKLGQLRQFGGLQAYPSRLRDPDGFDFSTGSVGLGVVAPNFMALVDQYVKDHFGSRVPHRFVALMGDAELDEGNVWEALGEDNLQHLGRILWMIDLNRQSLDRVVPSGRVQKIAEMLRSFGFHTIELKYGRRLERIFQQPGGERLRARIDQMSNEEYQSLLRIEDNAELGAHLCGTDETLSELLRDADLPALVADLGGHDFVKLASAFEQARTITDRPVALIAYTVKGWGLPIAGDPANHSRLLTEQQVETLRVASGIESGHEFDGFPPPSAEAKLTAEVHQRLNGGRGARRAAPRLDITVPEDLGASYAAEVSTQQAFGQVLAELARHPQIRKRMVTASPDVAVSTNLAGWIQKAGVYCPEERCDYFETAHIPVLVRWKQGPGGQHFELGISENNLFLMLGALGLAGDLLGEPLVPVGTIYDSFISRGLDALHYSIYNGARFILAGTPSGISLSPEGALHQSLMPPAFGIESPRLCYYEPCFAREVEWILLDAVRRMLHEPDSDSVYLRLSTVAQPQGLLPDGPELRRKVIEGGYRLVDRAGEPGYRPGENVVNLFTCGALLPLAAEASRQLAEEELFVNVINVTSPDLLFRGWQRSNQARMRGSVVAHPLETLIPLTERRCPVVTVMDGHPHALSFIGSVFGAPTIALGVDSYGQSGTRQELYDHYGIGLAAMQRAVLASIQNEQS
ncbi:MAG: pyruvate dehydrogenase [Bryobacteraceae bacterium]